MKKHINHSNDGCGVFHDHAQNETKDSREQRRYYCDLVLTSIASLFIGYILSAFFKAGGLFGLGCGLLFSFLCGYVARRL